MASQNEIANWSLDLLGEVSINDISDGVERAQRLLAAWTPVRDTLLRGKWWRFAIVRKSLAALATAPAWGFTRQYQIDGDVVRVIQVDQYYPSVDLSDFVGADTSTYRIEGDKILTNLASPLKVRWIVNSIAVGLWDPCFAKVMACDLAERICPRITGSETILARIAAQRREAMVDAQRANALEQPPHTWADGSWMASRFAV